MIFLLVRSLPWFIGLLAYAASQWQWRHADFYPWPLVSVVIGYIVSATLISYRRLSLDELISKILPSVLVLTSIGFAFLLIEAPEARLALSILYAGIAVASLEMLWLLIFAPARYPVHGLTRLNMAFMPLTFFFSVLGLTGLMYFIRIPEWITPAVMALVGASAFVLTIHHSHSNTHRFRWATIGAAIGFQLGLLANVLPVSNIVHGAIAAILIAIPLRIRRYGTGTTPRHSIAWSEGISASILFLTVLLVSRWA